MKITFGAIQISALQIDGLRGMPLKRLYNFNKKNIGDVQIICVLQIGDLRRMPLKTGLQTQ